MTDLPYLTARLYGTPLLIARPKLEVILSVMEAKLAGASMAAPSVPDAAMPQTDEGIAIIPILGTLVRRSSYLGAASGLTSYHDIEAQAEAAFADPAIRAVLLEIDSSGGEAGGVFDLAQRLRSLADASGKPLWAVADEAALSAAYAIACAADRLWLTRTAEVGSIGVVAVHVDESAADAKAGLNYTFLHAGARKVDGHPHAPLSPAVATDIQADIDHLYAQFVALVAGFRPVSAEAIRATEARVYRGESAVRMGLADQVGSLREAVTALQASLTAFPVSHFPFPVPTAQEVNMTDPATVAPGDDINPPATPSTVDDPVHDADQPSATEAAITAQVEQRLRKQMAELNEIAAQARRLGVAVDPAQALAQGVTPDALRQTVLKEAASRDAAQDIVAQAGQAALHPEQTLAASPLVKAAQAFGATK